MSDNKPLAENLVCNLSQFCKKNRLADIYRSYKWGSDSWETGFIDLLRIERQWSPHLLSEGVTLDDVKDIADWHNTVWSRFKGENLSESPVNNWPAFKEDFLLSVHQLHQDAIDQNGGKGTDKRQQNGNKNSLQIKRG